MKDRQTSIEIEKLLVMFIIAMGEWNGSQWEYFPKLPSCFTENVKLRLPLTTFNGDFLSLRVNDNMEVECWFIDENEEQYYFSLETIKMAAPLLFTSIVTHVFDMIENVKEC